MVNAYQVLGIRNFATQKEIKTAYRKMSKIYHPDLHHGNTFYEEKFKEIQIAYETLSNIERRMELDSYLRKLHHEEVAYKQDEKSSKGGQQEVFNEAGYYTTNSVKLRPGARKEIIKILVPFVVILMLTGVFIFRLGEESAITDHVTNNSVTVPDTCQSLALLNDQQGESLIINDKEVNDRGYFSMNATRGNVRMIQGDPDNIVEVRSLNQEIWYYEMSSVTFEKGRLSEYANISDNLKITYFAAVKRGKSKALSIGATQKDVYSSFGTPTSTMRIKPLDQEIWYYGESRILFEKGEVSEYSNTGRNLLVQEI